VGEVTLRSIEERGVTQFLEGIQAGLKAGRYRPQPAKRRYIVTTDEASKQIYWWHQSRGAPALREEHGGNLFGGDKGKGTSGSPARPKVPIRWAGADCPVVAG
jgi:hypothetical protein